MTCRCKCGGHSAVLDSRQQPDGVIRRRRRCNLCSLRWTTVELTYEAARKAQIKTATEAKRLRYAAGVLSRFFQEYLNANP